MSRFPQWDIVSSVGLTALVVAAGRSADTYRPDPLIQDVWAERFVEAAKPPVPLPTRPTPVQEGDEESAWQMMSAYMGVRTRYFDRYFLDAAAAGVRQAVILAAGLDTRAHRLDWPGGTRVFEVDQATVLHFKQQVLDAHGGVPTSERHAVPVDLRDDWAAALTDAGFDASMPTAWLAEGLLPYLPGEAEVALLTTVDALSAPGSQLAVENFTNLIEQLDDPTFQRLGEQYGVDMSALLYHDDREDPGHWLADHGWDVRTDLAVDAAAEYGREFDPLTQRLNGKTRFQVASR